MTEAQGVEVIALLKSIKFDVIVIYLVVFAILGIQIAGALNANKRR